GIAVFAVGHRVVEDETRAADQVTMACVINATVVAVVMEEAALRIDAVRMVEGHRVGDMRAQEGRGAEVGSGGIHAMASCCCSSCCTSSSVGMAANAPLRVTASAPTAAAKRSVSAMACVSRQNAAKPAPVAARSAGPYSTPPTEASPAAVVSTASTRKLDTSP